MWRTATSGQRARVSQHFAPVDRRFTAKVRIAQPHQRKQLCREHILRTGLKTYVVTVFTPNAINQINQSVIEKIEKRLLISPRLFRHQLLKDEPRQR
ncbi:Uncharacterised protein [Vibrio cholerae]|nr:Uncharacterised protein [Vibrio cholerae]